MPHPCPVGGRHGGGTLGWGSLGDMSREPQEEALLAPACTGRRPPNPGLHERPIHGCPQGEPREPPHKREAPPTGTMGPMSPCVQPAPRRGLGSGVCLGGSRDAPPRGSRLTYPGLEGAPCPVLVTTPTQHPQAGDMMGAGLSPSLLTAPQDLAEGGPRSSPPAHQAPAALAAASQAARLT